MFINVYIYIYKFKVNKYNIFKYVLKSSDMMNHFASVLTTTCTGSLTTTKKDAVSIKPSFLDDFGSCHPQAKRLRSRGRSSSHGLVSYPRWNSIMSRCVFLNSS